MLKYSVETFVNLEYIVYSTCSLFPKENEEVINELLNHFNNSTTDENEEENEIEEETKENVDKENNEDVENVAKLPVNLELIDLGESSNGTLDKGFDSNQIIDFRSCEENNEDSNLIEEESNKQPEGETFQTERTVRAYPFTRVQDGFFVALLKVNRG